MKYIVFLFLICFSVFVRAESIPSDALIVQFLTGVQKMTLHFHQTKTIPEIERSFQSSGVFQFEKNKGIIMKQEKPSVRTFISTTEEFCLDGQKESLEKLPHFSDVKNLIDHLLEGDMTDLVKVFEITYSEKNKIWQLDLVPIRREMKNFIQKIVLKGNINAIQKIIIEYTDGTKMGIDYSPTQQDLTDEIKC